MLTAVIEHLLRFGDAADPRAGETAATAHQRKDLYHGRGGWYADARHHSIEVQHLQVHVVVVRCGRCVEDEVEISGQRLDLLRIARERELVRSQSAGIGLL